MAQAGGNGFFSDGGYPAGAGWDEVGLPDIADTNAYALEISGESMEPVFRDGDMIVVSARGIDPPRRSRGCPHSARRGHGQTSRPPLSPAHRASELQRRPSQLQFRIDRNRLDAPDHLGQPVSHRAARFRPRLPRQHRRARAPCEPRALHVQKPTRIAITTATVPTTMASGQLRFLWKYLSAIDVWDGSVSRRDQIAQLVG